MELFEIKNNIENYQDKLNQLKQSFDLEANQTRLQELETMMLDASFYQNQKEAIKKNKEHAKIKETIIRFLELDDNLTKIIEWYDFIKLEFDQEIYDELVIDLTNFINQFDQFETVMLLNEPYDDLGCLLEFHPGAGGVESQDWALMLYRMYIRYAEKANFKISLISYASGDEAGIKSAVIQIEGTNAYGLLKNEKGIHRLVRISPFDSNDRRHTSFASVDVMPLFDDNIEVDLNENDLEIDTFKSSGAGGQSVNTTDSAVRVTHKPTGIVVNCQNERSQIRNREKAIQILKSKLYQLALEKQKEELAKIQGEKNDIGWGNQIRSYVFQPYSLVKDHRSKCEHSNPSAVMDGDIERFIYAMLKFNIKDKTNEKES